MPETPARESSFARLVLEGQELLDRNPRFDASLLFSTPGVDAMTSMIMCLTLALSARDNTNPDWLSEPPVKAKRTRTSVTTDGGTP